MKHVEGQSYEEMAEELLCVGLGPGHVERQLAKDHGIGLRQARRYIEKVYERWREQYTVAGALAALLKHLQKAKVYVAYMYAFIGFSADKAVMVW